MPILSAASPVEIVAKADDLGLPAIARAAALELFHTLTSAEELAAMDVPAGNPADGRPGAHDGSRWPAHAFLFGPAAELAPVLASLRQRPGTAELAAGTSPQAPAPEILFLSGQQDGFTGVLVAGAGQSALAGVLPGSVEPDL